ncbi:MAG: ATP-binding protein [Bdellovibrionaceae bacterium]|nr:ATP-binding protein [Pseudobdellovibrionaceae bacterium]
MLVRPEKLFGRHCAVLGATGGGKSWTVSRLLEECLAHNAKVVLLDPTSEYRGQGGPFVAHCHMGDPVELANGSKDISLPPSDFTESDFIALFEPSGKVQGPKLREAIRSLRLGNLKPGLTEDGILKKCGQEKKPIEACFKYHSQTLEDPAAPFDATKLARQLMEECVFPDGGNKSSPDPTRWGGYSDSDKTYCLPLASRIHAIVRSDAFAPVFRNDTSATSIGAEFERFFAGPERLLRICVGGVSYEYRAREFIANAIGRMLLTKARAGTFRDRPIIAVVDEAHNFLGRHVGNEDSMIRLDAFEIIAREGRKYGLNLCLATQRPRDLTEGVLSQIGTLIVHRLTNDRDREVVEKACGEIDRSATAFLANLRQGEAVVVGADFPIPMTVQISAPTQKPFSDGPDYQVAWRAALSVVNTNPEALSNNGGPSTP